MLTVWDRGPCPNAKKQNIDGQKNFD
jgi:hypothetical protein